MSLQTTSAFLPDPYTGGCFSCPFCLAECLRVKKAPKPGQDPEKTHHKRVWGLATLNQPLRTKEAMLKIYREYKGDDPLKNQGQKIPASPLLTLPNFCMLSQVVYDCMHSFCNGVIKSLFRHTFDVHKPTAAAGKRADGRVRISGKYPMLELNDKLECLEVPSEFSRHRRIDYQHMKAEEWRNVGIMFAPLLWGCLPDTADGRDVQVIWRLTFFKARLYMCADCNYESWTERDSRQLTWDMQSRIEETFGEEVINLTYHLLSHLGTIEYPH